MNGIPFRYVKLPAGIDRSLVMSNHSHVLSQVQETVDFSCKEEL